MTGKIYCMLWTGKPITPPIADALLLNAIDMYEHNHQTQRIKNRQYDGIIQSNLEPINYHGVPAIQFQALIGTDQWEAIQAHYIVRIDDLTNIELGQWTNPLQITFDPETN
jgi:hypothetical protein